MTSGNGSAAVPLSVIRARAAWRHRGNPEREGPPPGVRFEPVPPGGESVWSYPRPPRVEDLAAEVRVVFAGETIARSRRARRVLETAGAPTIYLPPDDVRLACLHPSGARSFCEWKGEATSYDVRAGGRTARSAAWSYARPLADLDAEFERIAGWFAFMPAAMDACFLGDERVRPQPGGFYGGWVTDALAGPIKGAPGSEAW